jgi:hypothetical protein
MSTFVCNAKISSWYTKRSLGCIGPPILSRFFEHVNNEENRDKIEFYYHFSPTNQWIDQKGQQNIKLIYPQLYC